MIDLVTRLKDRANRTLAEVENCQRIVDLLQPEWDRFEKREGHNLYASRMYADHTASIRTLTKELADWGAAHALALRHDARVTELIAYNNREVEKRRIAAINLKEAVQLLHTARRLIRGQTTGEAMNFLADSESFLADELNVRPDYGQDMTRDQPLAGWPQPTQAEIDAEFPGWRDGL